MNHSFLSGANVLRSYLLDELSAGGAPTLYMLALINCNFRGDIFQPFTKFRATPVGVLPSLYWLQLSPRKRSLPAQQVIRDYKRSHIELPPLNALGNCPSHLQMSMGKWMHNQPWLSEASYRLHQLGPCPFSLLSPADWPVCCSLTVFRKMCREGKVVILISLLWLKNQIM